MYQFYLHVKSEMKEKAKLWSRLLPTLWNVRLWFVFSEFFGVRCQTLKTTSSTALIIYILRSWLGQSIWCLLRRSNLTKRFFISYTVYLFPFARLFFIHLARFRSIPSDGQRVINYLGFFFFPTRMVRSISGVYYFINLGVWLWWDLPGLISTQTRQFSVFMSWPHGS